MTLFRDNKHSEYEDKEWVFVVEDVSTSTLLTPCLLMLSAENLCKQFGPKSAATKHEA